MGDPVVSCSLPATQHDSNPDGFPVAMTGTRSTTLTSILCLVLAIRIAPARAQEPAAPAPADSTETTILEDLVVTAEGGVEAEVQTGFLDIDAATLAAVPGIVEADPLRALQVLPGVQAASDISSGLYIRGGGPDQTLVLMDGVTVYNPTHAFGFFSTFNNDAVDRVDLFKGAYPARYGGRLGAVVDVRMRQESAPRTSVTGGVSLISARALVEGRAGSDQWLVSARRSYLEPLLDALRTPEDPIPSYAFYDLNGTYVSDRGGGRTVFTIYHGHDGIFVDADANTAFDLGWGNTVASLRHARFLGDTTEGSLGISLSDYRSATEAEFLATAFDIDNRLRDVTLRGDLDWQPSASHRLTAGMSASWYDFAYLQGFNKEAYVDYDARPRETAAYLEEHWTPDGATTVGLGLRGRRISDGGRTYLEPRLALRRGLGDAWAVKLGGGIYNQYLQLVTTEGFTAGDFYLPIDESADPGRSWQSVAGVEWRPRPEDRLSLEIYATELENLVEFDNRAPVDQTGFTADDIFVTGGEGYARGVELFYQKTMGETTAWLGYTLGWTERRFAELNDGQWYPPKYDRRHDLTALVTWRAGSWDLGASFRYATGQAFTPAAARYQLQDPATGQDPVTALVLPAERNSARLAPYHRLDLSASRPIRIFGQPLELVIEVFNVYNRRNEWFVQYNTDEEVTEATMVRMLPIIPSVGVNFAF